jgi:hypothetical protein
VSYAVVAQVSLVAFLALAKVKARALSTLIPD